MALRQTLLVTAASVVTVAAGWLPGADAHVSRIAAATAGTNRRIAKTQAASLLASITVPPGSTSSSTEPSGDGSVLARPASYPATPNLVDDHAWWVVPGTPSAAIAAIEAHPPHHSKLDSSGNGNSAPGFQFIGFDWGSVAQRLSTRTVVIEVVQLPNGNTGLRVDAEVVWITPRPIAERIPAGVAELTVSVTRNQQVLQRPFTITSRSRIRRVASLIDALPAAQPGAPACPNDPGVEDRLTFQSAAGRPLAVIAADPGGCSDVTVNIRGHRQPALTSAAFPGSGRSPHVSLAARLGSALGVRLKNPHL